MITGDHNPLKKRIVGEGIKVAPTLPLVVFNKHFFKKLNISYAIMRHIEVKILTQLIIYDKNFFLFKKSIFV